MKKVLALALALVMAFSMSAMAFAADATTTTKAAAAAEPVKVCPICLNEFMNATEYNKHLEICDVKADGSETLMNDFDIKDILEMLVELLKGSMGQWDNIEGVVIRVVDLVQKIVELGASAVKEAEVKGAIADLENALADIKLPKVDEFLNKIKQFVKDTYAGEVATTVIEETTVIEAPEEVLGSSSVGIALFAAVSVAAAAAYVCTKKSK